MRTASGEQAEAGDVGVSAHRLINQDSGACEWYTPTEIVEAARRVMGGIDLDPASSFAANEIVRAAKFYDARGLSYEWQGRVWMNHPFSRVGNKAWPAKLIEEYHRSNVTQACCITFAATSEAWFQGLAQFPQCYLSPRTNYYLPDGSKKRGVTKGSVVTYLGERVDAFAREFRGMGVVKVAL